MKIDMQLTVNGATESISAPASASLLDVLRDVLFLTGTKSGCDTGACGACTVLRDGVPTRACLTLAADCADYQLTTVEGLAPLGDMHFIQQAFIDVAAPQCGFCMSGMVLTASALLVANPNPTRDEIRAALSGNLCRCTGYIKILEAVELAAARQS